MSNKRPAKEDDEDTFFANPTPANAIRLAIDDLMGVRMRDLEHIDKLRKAIAKTRVALSTPTKA